MGIPVIATNGEEAKNLVVGQDKYRGQHRQ